MYTLALETRKLRNFKSVKSTKYPLWLYMHMTFLLNVVTAVVESNVNMPINIKCLSVFLSLILFINCVAAVGRLQNKLQIQVKINKTNGR